jgi:integrase
MTGEPLNYGNLRSRVLVPTGEEAGLPWVTFHTFRHTCASMLFDRGSNAKQVQRQLGHHSSALTLETYIHLLSDDVDAARAARRGNKRATCHPETGRTADPVHAREMAA